MNKIALAWFKFWKKRKWLFFLLAVTALFVQLFSSKNLVFQQNIADTFPETEQFEKYSEIVEHKGLNSTLYLSITPKNKSFSSAEWLDKASEFKEDFSNQCDGDLKNITFQLNEEGFGVYDFINEQIPWLLGEEDYQTLEARIPADSISARILANHQKLFTPEGLALKEILIEDPLQFNVIVLNKLKELSSESIYEERDGIMFLKGTESVLFTADVAFNTDEGDKAEILYDHLIELKSKWNDTYEIDYYSTVLIGAANSKQIKADTKITVTVSIIGLVLLFSFYYRSAIVPLFFILTIVLAVAFALFILSLFHSEVSGIAIGATAVVLGMIMDYSFHFFTHLKHSESIEETLNDVINPLFIGCFTTVLAFGALLFTTSPVLQDFGLFAALSLIGAAFSVSFVVPLMIPNFMIEKWKKKESKEIKFKVGKPVKRIGALLVIGFTVLAFYKASDVSFDDDLYGLGFYPDDLKEAEVKFQNINGENQRRVFILSEGKDKASAQLADLQTSQKLNDLKQNGRIGSFVNASIIDIPDSIKKERVANWNLFWLEKGSNVNKTVDSLEIVLDYYENTFDHFKEKTSGNYEPNLTATPPAVFTDFKVLEDETENGWVYVSYFTVDLEHKDEVVQELKTDLLNSTIIDKSAIANDLIQTVQSDFNFILLTSSLLVFFTLIIIYGRIELALITFLPMLVSWIWILGAASMLDIKFNMVNIVICTFIFGLGDDFSVFLTDGYLKKFGTNTNVLASYKKAIILSALSTTIGTGALIFSKHPALYSIATISILGMVAIVLVSFTIQPYLLRALMTKRKEKGLPPVTIVNFITSIICFSLFLTGALIMYPVQLIFKLIPFGQNKLKGFYHRMMRVVSWVNIHAMINVKKVFHNMERLDFSKPSIIIANHQSFIDVLLMISLNPKMVVMTNDWVYKSPIFGAQIKYLDFFPGSRGIEENEEKLRPLVEQGYSIMIFPEGTRSKDKQIKRFHKGAFYLAEKFKMDITPIMLHGFNDAMRKNDFFLQNGRINIAVLPRIAWDDKTYGETIRERTKSISAYFRKEFAAFDVEHSDSKYLSHKIISNYIYKTPVIEWYVRVKWMLERKNYDHYHEILPTDGKILDMGCGLGYLTYYLHLRSNSRHLVGVDYDEDKIQIAQNCWVNNDNTEFICSDITTFDMQMYDAIILADTLHYLTEEQQLMMMSRSVEHLTDSGVILIRDGITDLESGHKRTELTEKYSTKTMKFNKTVNDLSFFSKEFIFDFAEKNGLQCELVDQGKKSSNSLFVLKR